MRRPLLVALALCCVLSVGVTAAPLASPSAAGAAASDVRPFGSASDARPSAVPATAHLQSACADSPFVVCVPDTTNYLAPPREEVVVTRYNHTGLDLSATLAVETTALEGQFRDETLQAAFSAADTDAARRAVLERYTARVETRTEMLRETEREALAAFNAGTVTTNSYLRTLAELDAAGDRLRGTVDRLDSYRLRVQESDVTGQRLDAIEADLVALDGPIRERIQSVHAGVRPPMRVFVETSADGVTLSAIVEKNGQRTFLRETYLGDVRRQSSGPDQYEDNLGNAVRRVQELYPWATQNGLVQTDRYADVYKIWFTTNDEGFWLETFLDGQSGTVFAERQEKEVASIPTTTKRKANATAGLALTIERTHEGGPLNVTVTDPETNEPLDARVAVNNRTVGRTGANGSLWTVMPRSVIVTITAERDGERVTATIFAREQRSLRGPAAGPSF